MAVHDLEEFIRVIETAERMSAGSLASTAVTDAFGASSRSNLYSAAAVRVPRLWKPTTDSEFLGSSCEAPSPVRTTLSGSTSTRRSTSSRLSSSTSGTAQASTRTAATSNSRSLATVKSRPDSAATENKQRDSVDPLVRLQQHSRFARVEAKDLSPATTPNASPAVTRRQVRKPDTPKKQAGKSEESPIKEEGGKEQASLEDAAAPNKSPSKSTKTLTSSSASTKSSPLISPPAKSKKSSSSSSSSRRSKSLITDVEVEEDICPSNTSPLENSSGSEGGTGNLPSSPLKRDSIRSLDEFMSSPPSSSCRSPSPGRPRTPPVPRPTVTISNVRVHVHSIENKSPPSPPPPALLAPPAARRRPTRPRSAPPKKQPDVEPEVDMRSYSKSLKFLGLALPSNRKEAVIFSHHHVEVKTKEPTMRTRLIERTQSVSDLRDIIDTKSHLPKKTFQDIRAPLKQAVFEGWYFDKLAKEAERKRVAEAERRAETAQRLAVQEEKKERAQEEFRLWLHRKRLEAKKKVSGGRKKTNVRERDSEERREKIKKAEAEWKEKKRKESFKAKRKFEHLKQQLDETQLEKEKKREMAEQQFERWKAQVSEKLSKRVHDEKEKRLADLERKRAEAKEKKEAAEAAFNAWKAKKEKTRQAEGSSRVARATTEKEKKQEAAARAYDDWLEYVEQRELEEKYAEEERILRHLWRPPWYPAGIADF